MTRFHYASLPVDAVIAASRVITQKDAYISEEPEITAARELCQKGYRWIRSEEGFAIFEKAFVSPDGDHDLIPVGEKSKKGGREK